MGWVIGLGGALGWAAIACAAGPGDAGPAAAPSFAGDPQPAASIPGDAAVTPAPVADPVQALLNDHQYSAAVRLASKTLNGSSNLSGTGAGPVDRYRMLILKGEALLGLHETYIAIDQFQEATRASQDPRDVALARNAMQLVRRSSGGSYVPKFAPPDSPPGTPKGAPIPLAGVNLLDVDQRKPAFNALLDDELTAMQPRIHAAAAAGAASLTSIYPVVVQVEDLAQLDMVANGDATKTAAIAGELLDHVHTMLSSSLKDMSGRLSDIEQYANQVSNFSTAYSPTAIGMVGASYTTAGIVKRNGLSQSNKTELTNMIAMCAKIHQASDAFGTVARTATAATNDASAAAGPTAGGSGGGPAALGGANPPLPGAGPGLTPASADDWASIGSDADRLAGHAKDILDTNFDNGSTAYSTQTNDPYGATTGYGGVGGTGYYPGAGVVPANGVVPNNGIVPNYGAFPPNRLGSKTTVGGSPTSRPSGGSTGSR